MPIGALAALLIPFAAGCAAKRPVLYPNQQLRYVGQAGAQEDVDVCMASAEQYGASGNAAADTASSTTTAAATGAAVGAAMGAVSGSPGLWAARGAAGGGAGGFMRGLFRWRDPDPIEARFVQQCLYDRGYQVIGWR